MTRASAIAGAQAYFDDGRFVAELTRRVAFQTESQEGRADQAEGYLQQEIGPALAGLGFKWQQVENPDAPACPFLIAERREGDELPTVLTYGHGDVIRGQDKQWTKGRGPWELAVDGDRLYGRGTADNKGQHTINMAALAQVMQARGGKLGFNVRMLLETGEETGSPGLHKVADQHRGDLTADVLIASDGPRLEAKRPMLYLGSRGTMNFSLSIKYREGGHHSGNWGGLLTNPAIVLANAIGTIVDSHGHIKLEALRAPQITNSVRHALADIKLRDGPEEGTSIDPDWGEPSYSPAERVFYSNTFEVLAFGAGNPNAPVNAIPPSAVAHCQIRFIAGSNYKNFIPAIRAHLDENGFDMIKIASREYVMHATSLMPDHPWAAWAAKSIKETTGQHPHILPNAGGSLPNDVFAEILGMPTVWVPHSYGGCSQHAPDEHMLGPVVREGLSIMAGLFWDLGEAGSGRPLKAV